MVSDRSGRPRARDELVEWLDGHVNLETSTTSRGSVPTLERIQELCRLLGEPQGCAPVIHVTGTNGKGSTVAILTQLLAAKGLRVGAYTSPDLARVNERLACDGQPIDDVALADALGALRELEPMLSARPTRFELLTAAAFRWFADEAVDVAVVEVGLGGRWDATNVVLPEVAVVTNVSYDHVELLGPTLVDIAGEKSGIIKPGCRVVVGERSPELVDLFGRAAEEAGALEAWFAGVEFDVVANSVAVGGRLLDLRTPAGRYEDLFLGLHGAHQGDNAVVALAAAEAFFGAPPETPLVEEAFATVRVPGRLEVAGRDPLIVLDGAHNVAGVDALARSLRGEFGARADPDRSGPDGSPGETVAVVGMLSGRDPGAMLEALHRGGVDVVVACEAPSPRTIPATEVAEAARVLGLRALVAQGVDEAMVLGRSTAGPSGLVVVTGSLYVVAAVRGRLRGGERDDGVEHGLDGPLSAQ